MKYDMEEQEDFLKNKMPYSMGDDQWEALQQRLKAKVLPQKKTMPLARKKTRLPLKAGIGIAAGLALLVSVYTVRQNKAPEQPVIALHSVQNAEQELDKTIGCLNEQELNWIHQLDENELPEQEEYFEN